MRSILCLSMILICLGCTRSNDLVDVSPIAADSIRICINSMEQLKSLNNGLDTFKVSRVVLEDDSEVVTDGQNLSVVYSVQPSSGGSSLFDSALTIRVKEDDVIKTYYSNVWSKGCRNGQEVQGYYTNLLRGTTIYNVNTFFNWTVRPFGAVGPRIKYLAVD